MNNDIINTSYVVNQLFFSKLYILYKNASAVNTYSVLKSVCAIHKNLYQLTLNMVGDMIHKKHELKLLRAPIIMGKT